MATGFFLLDHPQVLQQYTYPRRNNDKLSGTCIVHTSEWSTDFVGADASAEDCAWYMTRRTTYGAYHTMVDSDSIIEMVPYEYEAWQDSETNNWAVGISASLQAQHWTEVEYNRRLRIYRNLAKAAADFVIYMRDAKRITVPLRRITGAEARSKVPGFCAHGDSGIGRTDPGKNFNWTLFFQYTKEEINRIDGGGISGAGSAVDWFSMATKAELTDVVRTVVKEEIKEFLRYNNTSRTPFDLYRLIVDAGLKATEAVELLKSLPSAVWSEKLVSRYDSYYPEGADPVIVKHPAEAFLCVNNDRLNTLLIGPRDKKTGEIASKTPPPQPEPGPIVPS